jgi:hypothetical protein
MFSHCGEFTSFLPFLTILAESGHVWLKLVMPGVDIGSRTRPIRVTTVTSHEVSVDYSG